MSDHALLETLDGMSHGVVGTNPTRLQCDTCGNIETPAILVLMVTKFHAGDNYTARLCAGCRKDLNCKCPTCLRDNR